MLTTKKLISQHYSTTLFGSSFTQSSGEGKDACFKSNQKHTAGKTTIGQQQ
jgi:hypothetical protein